MFSREHLRADVSAALTVACVALPLSMAIALASDVPPAVGLTTAIVAGVVAGIFGGSDLSVTGPAAAMAVLVGQIVDRHGMAGLFYVTLAAGALQVATGVLGLGRIVRMIPVSVVHGFTAGIGILLLIGQLPRALGLPAPDESHVLDVLAHVGTYLAHARPAAAALAGFVCLATLLVPRVSPRTPAALIAVVIATMIASALGLDVPRLGEVPAALGLPSFPSLPAMGTVGALTADAFAVYALASLESLLSASATDRLVGGRPHDADQELVGQGLGNLAAGLFGGIPATNVIARSALNVQVGAKTRRATILHAIFLGLAVAIAAPLLATIPVAALGGVLLAVGARLASPHHLRDIWRRSRPEGVAFAVTTLVTVAFDLLAGIQAGCIAAAAVALLDLSRNRIRVHRADAEGSAHTVSLAGALTFLAAPRLDAIETKLMTLDPTCGIVFDLRHLDVLDVSAAEVLARILANRMQAGVRIALLGPSTEVRAQLLSLPEGRLLEDAVAFSETDVGRVLGAPAVPPRKRLLDGVERFREQVRSDMSPLLESLAETQKPHTLFLTCADSRLNPSLFTGTQPGELFIIRNIGALLPPYGSKTLNDEGAALEYALEILGVQHVIVCGHSRCGAMTALRNGGIPGHLHALHNWAAGAHAIAGDLASHESVDDATRACVLHQLENLQSYPIVQRRLAAGELTVAAWFYDVGTAEVHEWHEDTKRYEPFGYVSAE